MKFSPEHTYLLYLSLTVLFFLTFQVLAFVAQANNSQILFSNTGAIALDNNYFTIFNDDQCEHERLEQHYLEQHCFVQHDKFCNHKNPSNNSKTFYFNNANSINDSIETDPCFNIDFEGNSLDTWEGLYGHVEESNGYTVIDAAGFDPVQQFLTNSWEGYDPLALDCGINVPVVFDGSHAIRIGDNDGGFEVAWIRREIEVTEVNSLLLLHYAILLENPDHEYWEQPRFSVRILDSSYNIVTCGEYAVTAADNIPGFQTCGNWEIRNWTSDGIILEPFVGQTVILEIMVADCAQGAHGGYAYVEAECVPFSLLSNDFCPGENIELTIPDVFASYQWSTGEGDTTNSIMVSNAAANDSYDLTVTSVTGCEATISFSVPNPPALATNGILTSSETICPGDSMTLTVVGENIYSIYWEELNVYGSTVNVGPTITTTYNVIISDSLDCDMVQESVTVSVVPPDDLFLLQGDTTICIGNSLTLSASYSGPYQLQWQPLGIYGESVVVNPTETTTYTVFSTDPTSCLPDTAELTISVLDDPGISYSIADETICEGEEVELSIIGENILEVVWESEGISDSVITVSPDTTTYYPFTIYGLNECHLVEAGVWVNVDPVNPIEYQIDTLSVCPNESVVLEVVGTNIGSVYWPELDTVTNTLVVAPTTTTTYGFIATDLYNCSSTEDAIVVEYNEQDMLELIPNDILACYSTEVTIVANYSGDADLYWGEEYGYVGDSLTIVVTETSVFTVTTNDPSTCAPIPVEIMVNVLNPIPLSYDVPEQTLCPGESTTLEVTGTSVGQVFWPEFNVFGTSIEIGPVDSDTYFQFTVTDTEECEIQTSGVWVYAYNEPPIEYQNDTLSACPGESVNINIIGNGIGSVYWTDLEVSGNTITVSPEETTAYEFTVEGLYGCNSITDTVVVEFNEQSSLVLSADQTTICVGDSVTIMASYSGNADVYWDNDLGYIGESITLAPTVTTTYSVTTNDATTCAPDPTSITIEVLAAPSVNYYANNVVICPGESAPLEIVIADWSVISEVYWFDLDSYEATVQTSPDSSQYYYYTIENTVGCTSIYDSVYVEVYDVNPIEYTNDTLGACPGETVNINISGNNIGSVNWPDLGLSGTTIAVSPEETTAYEFTIVGINGCSSITDSVIVEFTEQYSLSVSSNQSTICQGDSITLTASYSGGGDIYWDNDIGYAGASITVAPSVTTTYSVTTNDQGSCAPDPDSITIEVLQVPAISYYVNDAVICPNETAELEIVVNDWSLISEVYWLDLDSYEAIAEVSPENAQYYYYTIENTVGCTSIYDSVYVEVNAVNELYFVQEDLTICQGESVMIDLIYDGTAPLIWDGIEEMENSFVLTPDSSLQIVVESSDTSACAPIPVELNITVLSADLDYQIQDVSFCEGETIELSVSGENIGTVYWESLTLTGNTITVTPSETTVYPILITDVNECTVVQDSIQLSLIEQFELTVETSADTICQGDSVTLFGIYDGILPLFWPELNATGNTVQFIPEISGYYSVVSLDESDCSAPSDSVYLTVINFPPLSYDSPAISVCLGDEVFIDLQAENYGSIAWQNSELTSPDLSFTPTQDTTLYFEITDLAFCKTHSDSVVVSVNSAFTLSVEQGDTAICSGDTLLLTAFYDGDTPVEWLGVDAQSLSVAVVPDSTTTYVIYALDSGNCAAPADSITVTVLNPPEVVVEIEGETVICQGDSAELFVTGSNLGTIYWPALDTISNSIVVAPDSTTTYLVLINDLFDCKVTLDSFVVNVNVTPPPLISPERGDTLICEGDTAILSITGENIEIVYWPELDLTTPILEVTPVDDTWYHFQVWDSLGCEVVDDSVEVMVRKLPIIEFVDPEPTICQFETIVVNAIGVEIDTFHWLEQNVFGPTIEIAPDSSITLYLQATDIIGCKSDIEEYDISVVIPPEMDYEISPLKVCLNDSLEITVEGDFIGTTYWPSQNTSNSSISILPEFTSNISVEVIDLFGCDTIVETIPIEVLPLPTVEVEKDLFKVCENELVQISLLNLSDGEQVEWLELESLNIDQNGASVSFAPTVSDSLTVQVTDANNCESIPKSIFIEVNELPEISLSAETDLVVCLGEQIELKVDWTDDNDSVEEIYVNSEPVGIEENLLYLPLESENIQIRAVDEDGCRSEEIVVPVEVHEFPQVDLGHDRCAVGQTELNAEFSNSTYLWQDDYTGANYTVEYSDFYYVEVENACGKTADSIYVEIDGCEFEMTTGFSPNGDGRNDFFGPIDVCNAGNYTDLEFRVFDRWGRKVFEGNTVGEAWDGLYKTKTSELGVYVWQLTYYSATCKRWFEQRGNVTLIR